jgi:ATP-dependent helicase/nuclease subunit A
MARRRQHREMLGEELRLLYVAMTRARDRLILTGSVVETRFDKLRTMNGEVDLEALLSARSYSDWLALWFSSRSPGTGLGGNGKIGSLQWAFHDDTKLIDAGDNVALPESVAELLSAEPGELQRLEQRLARQYSFTSATRQPAKMSVSALRRSALEAEDDLAEDMGSKLEVRGNRQAIKLRVAPSAFRAPLSSADIGTVHHTFLQLVSLEQVGSRTELRQEARRMQEENALSAEEVALLDFDGLAAFWASDLGGKVRAQAQFVQRELPFTARFSAAEILAITGKPPEPNLEEEFVVVQGVADLAVVRPEEVWLIDFKSDRIGKDELTGKIRAYAPQLSLYAQALTRIYRRPVSECWLYFLARREAVRVEV